jgi:hypothetical protein
MEPCVAECTAALIDRLTEFAESGQSFNLQHWMQFYAFDVIGLITVCIMTVSRETTALGINMV